MRPRVLTERDRPDDAAARDVDDGQLVARRAAQTVDRDDARPAAGRDDGLVRAVADRDDSRAVVLEIDQRRARRLLIGDEHEPGAQIGPGFCPDGAAIASRAREERQSGGESGESSRTSPWKLHALGDVDESRERALGRQPRHHGEELLLRLERLLAFDLDERARRAARAAPRRAAMSAMCGVVSSLAISRRPHAAMTCSS